MDGVATRATAQGASSVLIAGVTFVVLTSLAMVEYPGGSKYEAASHHYLFFENFFSDLGATKTHAGYSNTSSFVLFVLAMACVGISLTAFSDSWHGIGERRGVAVRTAWVYKWAAIGSGLCFIGVAVTPWNLVLELHNFFVRAAFALLLLFVLAMVAVQLRNRWPWRYVASNLVFVVILAAYVLVLLGGPSLDTHNGLTFQVGAQKVMVYSSILNLGYQAYGVKRAVTPVRAALQIAHR